MTDEEKKAAGTVEAENETTVTPEDRLTDEEREAKVKLEAEHKAELEAEREKARKAEEALARRRFEDSERKRKEKEANGWQDSSQEDKPLTRSELESVLRRERESARKEAQQIIIREKVSKISESETEAELVMEVHKNRSFPEGMSLDEQIEEAYLIANRKRILGKNSELKRALVSKDTVNKNASEAHMLPKDATEPKIDQRDLLVLNQTGFTWDAKANAYKKTTGARTVYKSKDLKKTWTVANS